MRRWGGWIRDGIELSGFGWLGLQVFGSQRKDCEGLCGGS